MIIANQRKPSMCLDAAVFLSSHAYTLRTLIHLPRQSRLLQIPLATGPAWPFAVALGLPSAAAIAARTQDDISAAASVDARAPVLGGDQEGHLLHRFFFFFLLRNSTRTCKAVYLQSRVLIPGTGLGLGCQLPMNEVAGVTAHSFVVVFKQNRRQQPNHIETTNANGNRNNAIIL
jgi:hypothetical protein